MNILILHEYKLTSATNIIAVKLIDELKKLGPNVSSFYFYNEFSSINEINKDSIWKYSVQSIHSRYYLSKRCENNWFNKNSSKKLGYFLTHPHFLFSFLFYKLDNKFMFRNGRRRLKKYCSDNNIDFVIGISAPHEIEKIVSNLDIKIPRYLIRFDPYAFNPCYPENEFSMRIEEEYIILNKIDKIFTTKLIIQDLIAQKSISKFASKMIPIEIPLISDNELHAISKVESKLCKLKDTQHVYLLHAGTFYDDIRNPQKLVDFMKNLPRKYVLVVAGNNSSDIHNYDMPISDRIIDLGRLNREEIAAVIEDSDFLISYNNLNTNMVPSKLFECINSGKPFINLCHTAQCPTIEYVKDYEMAFTIIADQSFPKNELLCFLESKKGCKISREEILYKYRKCTIDFVAEQILNESRDGLTMKKIAL